MRDDDGKGKPYVSCPHGEVVKSGPRKGELKWVRYGSPSSFGKDIENSYNLQRWRERRIIIGSTVTDDELTDMYVRLGEMDDKESDEALKLCDAIIARSKTLAKADLAAKRGTHAHELTEDDDRGASWLHRAERGEDLGIPQHVQEAMLEAWRLMCMAYDLEVMEIEQAVVHDRYRQAGTLDRIAHLRRDITFDNGVTLPSGTVLVLDLKTGKMRTSSGSIDYWHNYVVQVATYAGATPYDVETQRRVPATYEVDQDWAVIAHLPVDEALEGKAVCRLVLCDIAAGRQVIEDVILKAKEWNARRDLFAFTHADEPTVEVAVLEPAEAEPTPDRSVRHIFTADPIALERPQVTDEGDRMSDAQVAEIRKRAGELDPQAKAVLDVLAKEANAEGHPFSIGAGPTLRRWHIYRALLRLAAHWGADLEADFIRATLALVLPEAAQPGISLGGAIGSLDMDEAMRFVQAAIQVIAQDAVLTIDDAGQPKWLGVGNPAA